MKDYYEMKTVLSVLSEGVVTRGNLSATYNTISDTEVLCLTQVKTNHVPQFYVK